MSTILSPKPFSPDSRLLYRLQHNDAESFGQLSEKYYAVLFEYASKFLSDRQKIKECIRGAFTCLWEKRETALSILSVRHFLLRAVKTKVLKALYSSSQHSGLFDIPDEIDYRQEFAIAHPSLRILSKKQQEIIYLKFHQHLDIGQISELMDLSRQSVYHMLHDVLQELRSVLAPENAPPLALSV